MNALPILGDPVLGDLARNLLATSAIGRVAVDVGAFRAFFAETSDAYLLSVAVPVGDSDDWSADLAYLVGAFAARHRQLRLEFFEERSPGLVPILDLAGIRCQSARPALTVTARELKVVPGRVPARILFLNAEDAAAIDAFQAIEEASFDPALAADVRSWRPILTAGLAEGSITAALALVDQAPVAAAALLRGGEAAELVGVGVHPDHRGRGLGRAVCYRLLADHFAGGGSRVWLSADETARPLYDRLGFHPVGTHLNYGLRRS